MLPCVKILPITFWKCFLFGKNCLELKCKTIHQSKEFIKGYLIKMCTFLILSAAACGCFITGGNSVRNPFNCLWILGLIVRAPYSNFGEACQHGTMLWPSTYKDGITNDLVNLVGYISSTHAASLNPLSTIVCSASWQQIPHWNHKYYIIYYHTCTLSHVLELPAIKSMQLLFKGSTSIQSEVSYLNNEQNRDCLCQARNVSSFPPHCYSLHVNHKKMNTRNQTK